MKRILFITVVALSTSIGASNVQGQANVQGQGNVEGQGAPPQPSQDNVQRRRAVLASDLLIEQLTRKLAQAEGSDTEFRIAEDMEILASIVRDNLDVTFADAARDARDPHRHFADFFFQRADVADSKTVVERCSESLADYIPGQGVIIQLRIPAPQGKPASQADTGSAKEPPSQWEQTRRHLRGEGQSFFEIQCEKCHDAEAIKTTKWLNIYRAATDYDGGRPVTTHRPTTSALLHSVLETLAENGSHIRDLKPQERITISLNYSNEVRAPVAQPSTSPQPAKNDNPKEGEKPGAGTSETNPQPSDVKKPDGAAAGNAEPIPLPQRLVLDRWIGGVNAPQSEIDRMTLRRMYLDVFGRLPTVQEVRDAENSPSHESHDMLVEQLLRMDTSATQHHLWMDALTHRTVRPKAAFPNRGRLSVSVTKEQLDSVAANKTTSVELMGVAQIRVFEPKE